MLLVLRRQQARQQEHTAPRDALEPGQVLRPLSPRLPARAGLDPGHGDRASEVGEVGGVDGPPMQQHREELVRRMVGQALNAPPLHGPQL
jgi:hypothetical protein